MESSWPFPPPFLCLLSIFHELTVLYDFGRVHITDLASLSFKSAFACCCYMCVPNASRKLDLTPRCHTPSISLSSLFCSVSVCHLLCKPGELIAPQGTILMSLQIHRPHTTQPPLKHPQVKHKEGAHTETTQRVSADGADPGGKRSHLSEPLYHPQVQKHQTIKEKGNCQPSPRGAGYTI